MGRRGPAPTPSETLKARGTFREDRRRGEPDDDVALTTCPDWLDDEGKAEWKRLAPLLKKRRTVSKAACGVLAVLCESWSRYIKASTQLHKVMSCDDPDVLAASRWSGIAVSAGAAYLKAAAEFGLAPASRARVQATPGKEQKEGDGKARFFRVG